MYRQGDILLIKSQIPEGAKLSQSKIVAYGEATGHSHKIENGLIYEEGGRMFVRAEKDSAIVHDEHETIVLPEGEYQVIRQREYDEKEIRYVRD